MQPWLLLLLRYCIHRGLSAEETMHLLVYMYLVHFLRTRAGIDGSFYEARVHRATTAKLKDGFEFSTEFGATELCSEFVL